MAANVLGDKRDICDLKSLASVISIMDDIVFCESTFHSQGLANAGVRNSGVFNTTGCQWQPEWMITSEQRDCPYVKCTVGLSKSEVKLRGCRSRPMTSFSDNISNSIAM